MLTSRAYFRHHLLAVLTFAGAVACTPPRTGNDAGPMRPPQAGPGLEKPDAAAEPAGDAAADTAATSPMPTPVPMPPPPLPTQRPDGGAPEVATLEAAPPVDMPAAAPTPMPPPLRTPVKILPPNSAFLGSWTTSCSHGESADALTARWCAFHRPGSVAGKAELWVMNMNNLPVACDGTSSDCLRLTSDLFTGTGNTSVVYPEAHAFSGDTLLFYANVPSDAQVYQGPVYAWRPGWPSARRISATTEALICRAHASEPVALCVEGWNGTATPPFYNLYAGRIDTGAVKPIARLLPVHPTGTAVQAHATFSDDGKWLVFSTATEMSPESLYTIAVDRIGIDTPRAVGSPGISGWQLSRDATKIFYLRDYNYDGAKPSGTLHMADFPSGMNQVKLASAAIKGGAMGGVAFYQPVHNKQDGLAFVVVMQPTAKNDYDVRLIKNPAAPLDSPMNVIKLVDSTSGPLWSQDLRYGFASVRNPTTAAEDVHIVRSDGTAGCTLALAPSQYMFGAPFTGNADLVLWADNYNKTLNTADGMVASPADCQTKKRKFASRIDYWFIDGNERLIYSDDVQGPVATLRVAKIAGGDLGPGEVVATGVDRLFRLYANHEAVLFRIPNDTPALKAGTYFYRLGPP